MVKSEIFLGIVHLDNTREGRAVMIRPLFVFFDTPYPTISAILQA